MQLLAIAQNLPDMHVPGKFSIDFLAEVGLLISVYRALRNSLHTTAVALANAGSPTKHFAHTTGKPHG